MKIYLAGPIRGKTAREANSWRADIRLQLITGKPGIDFEFLDPMRGKPWLKDDTLITDAYPEYVLGCGPGIVERDLWDVRSCDLILANLIDCVSASIGTVIELGYAKAHNKIIVIAIDKDQINPHNHAMLLSLTPFVVHSLKEAVAVIKGLLPWSNS